jgi:hypothetical protein
MARITFDLVIKVPVKHITTLAERVVDFLRDEHDVRMKTKDILAREDFQKAAMAWITDRFNYLATDLDTHDFGYDKFYDIDKVFAAQIAARARELELEEARELELTIAKRAKQPSTVIFSVPRNREEEIVALLLKHGVKATVS